MRIALVLLVIRASISVEPISKLLSSVTNSDEKIGIEIILKALSYPLRQISENAGQEGSVIVQKVQQLPVEEGYDAREDKFVNMFKEGIVDPTKVVRCAIQFSASIASLLLTTEAIITDEKVEEKAVNCQQPHPEY